MTDKQLKSLIFRAGIVQTVLTALIGATMWIYAQGRANADIVHQSDLTSIQTDIKLIREDVSYIRGYIERK